MARWWLMPVGVCVVITIVLYQQQKVNWRTDADEELPTSEGSMRNSTSFLPNHTTPRLTKGPSELSFHEERLRCLRGLVTVAHGGRFGNLFMEWATALGIARHLNQRLPKHQRVVALPDKIWGPLTGALEGIEALPLINILRNRTTSGGLPCVTAVDENKLSQLITSEWRQIADEPRRADNDNPIILPMWVVHTPSIAPLAGELHRSVRFKGPPRAAAAAALRRIAHQTAASFDTTPEEVVLIGVHVRRTDYAQWLKNRLHTPPADEGYFRRALRWMLWAVRSREAEGMEGGVWEDSVMRKSTRQGRGTADGAQSSLQFTTSMADRSVASVTTTATKPPQAGVTERGKGAGVGAGEGRLSTRFVATGDAMLPLESVDTRAKKTPPPLQSLAQALAQLPPLPPVAVAVVSDDMRWVKKKLIPSLEAFLQDEKVRGVRVFAAGSPRPMDDLALLSLANHSIIAYGTYGEVGALLAGGRTAVYDLKHPEYSTLGFARLLPHWEAVP